MRILPPGGRTASRDGCLRGSGLTAGTVASAAWLLFRRARQDRRAGDALPVDMPPVPLPGRRHILRRLAAVALPVTLSAGVISPTKCVDLALILRRLQGAGVSGDRANALYGCYSTLAVPVFNILPSLSASVAMSLVPVLSGAVRRLRTGTAAGGMRGGGATGTARLRRSVGFDVGICRSRRTRIVWAWRRCVDIAVPRTAGGGRGGNAVAAPAGAGGAVRVSITVTGAMLQAAGHAAAPVVSMLIGTSVKAVLAYRLLALPDWGCLPHRLVLCAVTR